jgi:hypothetical protein
MSLNVTFGSILGLTFAGSSAMMTSSFSFPFDVVVEFVLSPFAPAETEDVECLFDLDLVAARMLCSRDDRKRLNVLSWMSGLTGVSEVLDDAGMVLSLGSGSRATLKGLEIASCALRCRTAEVMYVWHPKDERVGKGGNTMPT